MWLQRLAQRVPSLHAESLVRRFHDLVGGFNLIRYIARVYGEEKIVELTRTLRCWLASQGNRQAAQAIWERCFQRLVALARQRLPVRRVRPPARCRHR